MGVMKQTSLLMVVLTALLLMACEASNEPFVPYRPSDPVATTPRPPSEPAPRATPRAPAGPMRGLWVTRWDFRTPRDVTEAIERAASLGVTDIFWQVRGQGDAFYASPFEPWGEELLADLPPGSTEPGFDPLALAIIQSKSRGMRIHAWVNVMPLWRGTTPPKSSRHLYHTQPEWRLTDRNGKQQALNEHYVIVNPVLPEVQNHIVRIIADIVDRYAIDGIHLDYIRFVSESVDKTSIYPSDPRSLGLFAKDSGRRELKTDDDLRAFRAWKRNKITELVRRIRTEALSRKPGLIYSAAVWRDPTIAQVEYLQDAALWLREGTIDIAMPMIYSTNDQQFREDMNAWRQAVGSASLIPGLGAYMHDDPQQTIRQIRIASSPAGYAIFAYASLFDSANPLESMTPEARAKRQVRRQALGQFMRQDAARP